jgi:hypothetical protein
LNSGDWETKCDEYNYKMKINKKGTDLNKDIFVMFSEYYFDEDISYEHILKSTMDPNERAKFDKDLDAAENL